MEIRKETIQDVNVAFCMVKKHEPKGFEIDLPNGRENHSLFLMFETPIFLKTENRDYDLEKNSCIVYEANHRTTYSSKDHEMYNSFILFDCPTAFFQNYDFPLNAPFALKEGVAEKLALMLDDISFCFLFRPSSNDRIKEIFFEIMTLLSENFLPITQKRQKSSDLFMQFKELREKMYLAPANYTVSDMAKQLFFNRSYFSTAYKRFFHVTPADDILDAKLLLAQKLLDTGEYTVEQIAEQLQFDNAGNFIRFFKKRTNMTPHAYSSKTPPKKTDR